MNPTYKSTEFILSAVATVFSLLVSSGVLTPDAASSLTTSIGQIVSGVIAIVSIYHYVKSRTALKIASLPK